MPTEVESYVAAVTRESFDLKQIPRGAEALSQQIAADAHRSPITASSVSRPTACSPQVKSPKLGRAEALRQAMLA